MTTPPRVVVINDTQEILELFRDILTEMGCDVALMSYAPDDLHRIEQERPDLVVIDFVLGGREFEGWQLLQKLRMNRATESVPLIACTAALQQVRDQEGYLLEQNVTVVLKPFNVDQLEAAVRKALPMLSADGS
jgi:DNA-binding response OmpR family regulator